MTKKFYFNREDNQLIPVSKEEYEELLMIEMYRAYYANAETDPDYYSK